MRASQPGEVPTGPGEARDEPRGDGIAERHHDDGNAARGLPRSLDRLRASGNDHVDVEADQLGRQGGELIRSPVGRSHLDDDASPLDVPESTEPLPERAHRWALSTFQWDLWEPTLHKGGEFVLNAGRAPGEAGSQDLYHVPPTRNDTTHVADLTAPDAQGPHRVILGSRAFDNFPALDRYGADATLDEFVLYDFGPSADKLCTQVLARARFDEGRYYKGEGIYVSPAVELPPGSRLRSASWTFQRPPELPGDYAEIELTDGAGTDYLWGEAGSRSTLGPGWRKDLQRWHLSGASADRLRFRVIFRRDPAFPLGGGPVLESPTFDDLTLVYTPAAGVGILDWVIE